MSKSSEERHRVIPVKVEEYIFNVLVNKVISAAKKNLGDHKAAVGFQLGGDAVFGGHPILSAVCWECGP
jgi:hypothetical protein